MKRAMVKRIICISLTAAMVMSINSNAYAFENNRVDIEISEEEVVLEDYAFTDSGMANELLDNDSNAEDNYESIEVCNAAEIDTEMDALESEGIEELTTELSGSCGPTMTWILSTDGTLTISGSGKMTSAPWKDYCKYITKIDFNGDIENIIEYAFEKCENLSGELDLPDSISTIETNAFAYCEKLTGTLELPRDLTTLGSLAFYSCKGFTNIVFKNNVKYLYNLCFGYCTGLEGDLILPEGISTMSNPFYMCSGIDGVIEIPSTATSVTSDIATYMHNARKIINKSQKPIELPTITGDNWVAENNTRIEISGITNGVAIRKSDINIEISFDACGGTMVGDNTMVRAYSSPYCDLPTPTKYEYAFDGWYTAPDGGKLITADSVVLIDESHTLYAHWIPSAYTITFNSNGGECEVKSKSVAIGESYGELPVPCRFENHFVGWFLDDQQYFGTEEVNEAITLTAKWREYDKLSTPRADIPSNSTVVSGKIIKLSSELDSNIFYTLDGSTPTVESVQYDKGIEIKSSNTTDIRIKAVAVKEGYKQSDVASFLYHVEPYNRDIFGDIEVEDIPEGGSANVSRGFWIAGMQDSYDYTGAAIKPEIRVYHYNTLLKEKVDYSVAYSNNTKAASSTNAKAPTVTVKGCGNYSGTLKKTFSINAVNLESANVSYDSIMVPYNKRLQKVAPKIYYDGKLLKSGTDYKVSYAGTDSRQADYDPAAFTKPGTHKIHVTGNGNFVGSIDVDEVIVDASLMAKATTSSIKNQTYTGDEITLETIETPLTVKYGTNLLKEGVHYTVSYSNNVNPGTAYVILTGTGVETQEGIFVGTKAVKFTITGTALSKASIIGWTNDYIYTGDDIAQDVELTYGGETLIEDQDYTVLYTKNTNVGTATVVFTGMNAFTGSIKKTYRIKSYNIHNDDDGIIDIDYDQSYSYEKGGIEPKPVVTANGNILTEKVDYTLSYKNCKDVNDGSNERKLPAIVIKGKGNYTGTIEVNDFTIERSYVADMDIITPDVIASSRTNGWKSAPTITDSNGKVLKVGTDYIVAGYEYFNQVTLFDGTVRSVGDDVKANDIVPVGTDIKIIIEGINNYDGDAFDTYCIGAKDFNKVRATVKPQVFTGSQIVLSSSDFDVKDGANNKLTLGTDFIVIGYTNNVSKGNATVTIKGIDDYAGNKTLKFQIKVGDINIINQREAERRAAEEAARAMAGLTPIVCKDGTCYVTADQLAKIHATWDFAGDAIEMAGHHNIGELEAVIGPTKH